MDRKEKYKEYYLQNKEKKRLYRLENKEKKDEYMRQYYLKNKEKIKENRKEYLKTPEGFKSHTIAIWRSWGVIGDVDAIYDIYLATTQCMRCSIQFSERIKKCMDHDHVTGLYRAVLCNSCNCGNPLDLHCRKNNKSTGIKNITKTKYGYVFEKTTKGITHRKFFKTLEEAIQYKEQYLSELR